MVTKLDITRIAPAWPALYDVDRTVGYGAVNESDDVLLVQFLLKRYFLRPKLKPLGTMILDGIFGPITHYWLLFFQKSLEHFYKEEGATLDLIEYGNVGSFRDPRLAGRQPTQTMIGQLNGQAGDFYTGDWGKLEKDHTVPARLRYVLAKKAVVKM